MSDLTTSETTPSLKALWARLRASRTNGLLVLAVVLGVGAAFAIWLYREAIEVFTVLFREELAAHALGPVIGPLGLVVALALAGALVGWLMSRFVGDEKIHGVAAVIESVALSGGRLPYRKLPVKALSSSISLGAGASTGPEDPSVQIGANMGSWFSSMFHLREDHARLLVAAGVAAAVAAAFKAPIAGVFFALEVVLNGVFEARSFSVIVLASVVASGVTEALHPGPEMGPFAYTLGSPLEIVMFAPLGVALALVSVFFMRCMGWMHHRIGEIRLPRPAKTALVGALVGVVGIALPGILGIGREEMNAVLGGRDDYGLGMLLVLGFAKIVMTAISIGGGFVGGVFAPALFVGTMLGAAYGQIMQAIFPSWLIGAPQEYAIAGMAAVMAGVVRAPITAVLIVFELTNDYRLILPIMLTTVVCVLASELFEPHGLYIKSLIKKGVRLAFGREVDLMQGISVAEAMVSPAPSIAPDAPISEVRDSLRAQKTHSLCVVDEHGALVGMLTLTDLQRAYESGAGGLTAADICTRNAIIADPQEPLWAAIRRMSAHDVGRLPVVERGTGQLLGLIGRHGVVRAYNLAYARKLQDQHVAETVRLNTLTGGHTFEFHLVPSSPLVGKLIREVAWPTESVVAAIWRSGRLVMPHGSTKLQAGDTLTVVCAPQSEGDLRALIQHG